jgi:hypothetical protein
MTDDEIAAEIKRRLQLLAKLYVKTDEISEALVDIHELRETGFRGQDRDACCFFVVGPSSTGKSRLFSTYADNPHAQRDGDVWPILRFKVPPAVKNVEEFLVAILNALETEAFPANHKKSTMEGRILLHLKRRKVELIMIEEVQHLVDKKTGNLGYWGADEIKTLLLDTAKVPVVMSGIDIADNLFDANKQLATRRIGVLRLFVHDWRDPIHRARFQAAIKAFEAAARFPRKAGLADGPMAERIHRATGGIIGNLCRLFEAALKLGIRQGKDIVDQDLLAVVHAKLAGGGVGWKNVFSVAVLPPIEAPDESRQTKLHTRKAS